MCSSVSKFRHFQGCFSFGNVNVLTMLTVVEIGTVLFDFWRTMKNYTYFIFCIPNNLGLWIRLTWPLILTHIQDISWPLDTVAGYWYMCQLQLGWHQVAVVQYTFTYKQYVGQHNKQLWLEAFLVFEPRVVNNFGWKAFWYSNPEWSN